MSKDFGCIDDVCRYCEAQRASQRRWNRITHVLEVFVVVSIVWLAAYVSCNG